ncbi:MAG TPA: sugar ABC transporter ATP-binding protein [Bryobacteraceae bacterium]|jgi:ABC-type sugar transport system ATPase subunit
MPDELLTASEISKNYDGVRALRGAHFSLVRGEVHALVGENGAGKSTLAKILAGIVRPDSGTISIGGHPATIATPLDAQRLGISIIHQELDAFPNLSVAENIAIGNREFSDPALVSFEKLTQFAAGFLRKAGLSISPQRRLSTLSIGDSQLVMIARALSMRARIILMDEPTSSLFHDSVERLFRLIGELKEQGVSIVYVSHKMDELFRICDRMTVMRDGQTIGTRARSEVTLQELISMMVGRLWHASERQVRQSASTPLLSVSGLTTRKLNDISFALRKGEVLGIAGLVGAGRSELGAALTGLDEWKSGTMSLRGVTVRPRSVDDAQKLGMRLLAEDRKFDGLMLQMSVLENGTITDLPKFTSAGFISRAREEQTVRPLFERLKLKAGSLAATVNTLSGGNQQKVLFARCLLGDPEILFLDDPTRGVDIGAKEDIYALIDALARQGKAILFVSSELPELLRCADRILVLREGRLTATLDAAHTTQEEIMSFATRSGEPVCRR